MVNEKQQKLLRLLENDELRSWAIFKHEESDFDRKELIRKLVELSEWEVVEYADIPNNMVMTFEGCILRFYTETKLVYDTLPDLSNIPKTDLYRTKTLIMTLVVFEHDFGNKITPSSFIFEEKDRDTKTGFLTEEAEEEVFNVFFW